MPNHMKGCGCRSCRRGMHTRLMGKYVRRVVRSARRKAKEALRRGDEPLPCVSLDYTD